MGDPCFTLAILMFGMGTAFGWFVSILLMERESVRRSRGDNSNG
jgi:hypothetical protein